MAPRVEINRSLDDNSVDVEFSGFLVNSKYMSRIYIYNIGLYFSAELVAPFTFSAGKKMNSARNSAEKNRVYIL